MAIAPTFAQTITHAPLYTFYVDSFGISVSGAGDVNGDGFADLIVGAERDDNNGPDSGSARVFSGADGSVLYNFDGDSSFDRFGHSVSGAGDVNGDGFDDLIVGAFSDDNNGTGSGSARVFSGADGSVLYNFDGDSANDRFGISVSGAGDVNGDGFADLVVAADLDGNNGIINSGSARVFSGADGSVLYNFDGDTANNGLGTSVSGAGDVNGDGFADVIVGTEQVDSNGFSSGSARVFSGADGSVLYNVDGDSTNGFFGSSVSGAGDVNGDGLADVIVGARGTGAVRVFSGINGSVLYTFDGDSSRDSFGTSVSNTGDVNGDSFADVIVGDYLDDSNGTNSGSAQVFSGADGSILYNVDGDSGDRFGASVSGVGDVNGDGVADFIVGASNTAGSGVDGYARVFVSRITILGDVNQDGVVDFADIPAFIAALQSGTFLDQADCNRDGFVDFSDIPVFIAILQAG